MLIINRGTGTFRDDEFRNFPDHLQAGDCVVLNDTRVFPARLRGHRSKTGAAVEVFLVRALNEEETDWLALVKPGKRVHKGDEIVFGDTLTAEVLSQGEFGERTIRLQADRPVNQMLELFGETPLPPYIHRKPIADDKERYQTVFARQRGSVAAPTAGLHFTPEILDRCRARGAKIAHVTLHVGLGTFAPLREQNLADIRLHHERFQISSESAEIMRRARRLVCVGTTSVRTLETALLRGELDAISGDTNLFIAPGFVFRGTGAMLTNFHLPQSSLLMLVCAFAGRELALAAYGHAVAARYRFFSYGDCMLIE